MRSLSEKEIKEFMNEVKWGTLIALDGKQPYAVETSFASDDKFIYTGTKSGGRMNMCLEKNPVATFKICESAKDTSRFKAVIVESSAKILTERDEIVQALSLIYKKLGLPESRVEAKADQYCANSASVKLYRIPLQGLGGIATGN
jgi:nitroimidazol reductase NimA-like FMN-containing flavoprotein (pyridoxamine 5'-phosphate oxidase superfamily)